MAGDRFWASPTILDQACQLLQWLRQELPHFGVEVHWWIASKAKHGMEAGKRVVFPKIVARLWETCWYAFDKKFGLGHNFSWKRLDFAAVLPLPNKGLRWHGFEIHSFMYNSISWSILFGCTKDIIFDLLDRPYQCLIAKKEIMGRKGVDGNVT